MNLESKGLVELSHTELLEIVGGGDAYNAGHAIGATINQGFGVLCRTAQMFWDLLT